MEALHNIADASIPTVVLTSHQHKDNWYHCLEITELCARMNRVRKIFRRNPTEKNYRLLQEVVNYGNTETITIHHNKWLECCASLYEHILIGNLWYDLRRIAGKRTAIHKHPQPIKEANRLAEVLAGRTSLEIFPQLLGTCKSISTLVDGKE